MAPTRLIMQHSRYCLRIYLVKNSFLERSKFSNKILNIIILHKNSEFHDVIHGKSRLKNHRREEQFRLTYHSLPSSAFPFKAQAFPRPLGQTGRPVTVQLVSLFTFSTVRCRVSLRVVFFIFLCSFSSPPSTLPVIDITFF